MMLLNHFYDITKEGPGMDQKSIFSIKFHQEHEIFKAHFPGQPIVPGACLSQIAKELIELKETKTIQILQYNQLKFLNTINPFQFPEVEVTLEYKSVEFHKGVQVTFIKAPVSFAKLDFTYE